MPPTSGYENEANHSIQRIGASRSVQLPLLRERRLAPIANADRSHVCHKELES